MVAALFVRFEGTEVRISLSEIWFMANKSKPVKGKKAGNTKPLMKRVDLPGVKPLMKI
jgi:hypothetical protein